MPIIIGIFCALPFLAGLIAEYLVCRLTRRRCWKLLPPAGARLWKLLWGPRVVKDKGAR